jgi:hypothetical protein
MRKKLFIIEILLLFLLSFSYVGCGGGGSGDGDHNISGYILDASYPANTDVPISNAIISVNVYSTQSDSHGYFDLDYYGSSNPEVKISAEGYQTYIEYADRMMNEAFYLIPSGQIYEDFNIINWSSEENNPNNWHRKWDRQTEFYIIRNNASNEQIDDLIFILKQDEYSKMTAGLYSSNVDIKILETDPKWDLNRKRGKTIIYFAGGIIPGGIGYSVDGGDGIIEFAEIGWNTNQEIDENIVWHEICHTVAAGGHINYRKSVNSETMGGGYVYNEDEKVFNCIYNSPPQRDN